MLAIVEALTVVLKQLPVSRQALSPFNCSQEAFSAASLRRIAPRDAPHQFWCAVNELK